MQRHIYHVASADEWAQAKRDGAYRLSTRGKTLEQVGFIHASYANQVTRVANAIYSGTPALVLLVIDPTRVHARIQDDPADTGEVFPHVYGPLNLDAVVDVLPFEPSADGTYALPSAITED